MINLFNKETAVFFMLLPLYIGLRNKNGRYIFTCIVILVGYVALVGNKLINPNFHYIGRAGLSLATLKQNLQNYSGTFFAYLTIVHIWGFLTLWFGKERKWLAILFLANIGVFFPFTFWYAWDNYYLLVLQILLVIDVFYLTDIGISLAPEKIKKIVAMGSGLIVLTIFGVVFFNYDKEIIGHWHRKYLCEGKLFSYLTSNNFEGTDIYSDVDNYEANHKIYIYTNEWGAKSKSFTPSMGVWLKNDGANERKYYEELANSSRQMFLNNKNKKILVTNKDMLENDAIYKVVKLNEKSPFFQGECEYAVYTPK